MSADLINSPPHYSQGKIEAIDAIEAAGYGVDFCAGNAIKYLWRFKLKGSPLEDAKKAQWYVNRLVAALLQQIEQDPDK